MSTSTCAPIHAALPPTCMPREPPAPLVGKPAPAFTLNVLASPDQSLSPKDMQGKVWLLNVWSSWCVSCRQEHPVLVQFAKNASVPLVGLNYKEVRGYLLHSAKLRERVRTILGKLGRLVDGSVSAVGRLR